jgi:hypothetical protein
MDSGVNRDTTTGAHRRNELRADLPDACIVYDAYTYVIRSDPQLSDAADDLSRGILERLKRIRAASPQQQRKSRLDDASGHRCTLTSQAYESDLCHGR